VITFAVSQENGLGNGAGSDARFYHPTAITSDGSGNLFVTDYLNDIIRKISPSGIVSTYAGEGPYGIGFYSSLSGIDVGGDGNIFVASYSRHKIYKIDPAGVITDYAEDCVGLRRDGIDTSARFVTPNGIAMDIAGNIHVADAEGHRIRKIAPDHKVTTVAGSGEAGYADSEAGIAKFNVPQHIALDGQGNILVIDAGKNRIRKISKSGVVSTLAGNGNNGSKDCSADEAEVSNPLGITVAPDGKVYIVDNGTNRICVIIPQSFLILCWHAFCDVLTLNMV
jgi:DNA-binding beta-propeller fold protein YncE